MQLEETASAKDVPPLSCRGVFVLPGNIAQNNLHPGRKIGEKPRLAILLKPECICWKSLV